MCIPTLVEIPQRNKEEQVSALYNVKLPFPFKLHQMLQDVVAEGKDDIVSWLPHGRAFRVHKTLEFATFVMPRYFKQSKYKSFQRQLHIYGFRRINSKDMADYGAYYHEKFVRGEKTASLTMGRQKVKSQDELLGSRHSDPDFYQVTGMTQPCNNEETLLRRSKSVPFSPMITSSPLLKNQQATVSSSNTTMMESKNATFSLNSRNTFKRYSRFHQVLSDANACMLREQLLQCSQKGQLPERQQPDHATSSCFDFGSDDSATFDRRLPETEDDEYSEGDELLFEGKKFFYVEEPHRSGSNTINKYKSSRTFQAFRRSSRVQTCPNLQSSSCFAI